MPRGLSLATLCALLLQLALPGHSSDTVAGWLDVAPDAPIHAPDAGDDCPVCQLAASQLALAPSVPAAGPVALPAARRQAEPGHASAAGGRGPVARAPPLLHS